MTAALAGLALATAVLTLPSADAGDAGGTGGAGTGGPVAGAPGLGDPYFPKAGNGGYDVSRYVLDLDYDPATDQLRGTTTVHARVGGNSLSRFDLDLSGLTVDSVAVDGRRAGVERRQHELVISPAKNLRAGAFFTTVVRYHGVPEVAGSGQFAGGWHPTADGAVVAGQPSSATSWFPANDHPRDRARFDVTMTVPDGLDVVSNGRKVLDASADGERTVRWKAPAMAPYLTTMAIGHFDLTGTQANGLDYVNAVDEANLTPFAEPSTGTAFAISQSARATMKRLQHEITVPESGATVAFDVTRATEPDYDFAFVEVHTVGEDDWTTLPDENGHTSTDTGEACAEWPVQRPFLAHYQTYDAATQTCTSTGTTGEWNAASGSSDGAERWQVDLADFAGQDVELSITTVDDSSVPKDGIAVDDVDVSTGEGTTSFESGLDGWTVPGPPAGDAPNANDWIVGTVDDLPPSAGEYAQSAFDGQPQIVEFLSGMFGSYPFKQVGGILTSEPLGYALETQTRPIYEPAFFTDPLSSDLVVVHELAHQWFGDAVTVHRWSDIWLNEGFATYAEFMYYDEIGYSSVQDVVDFYYDFWDEDDPFWDVVVDDPGRGKMFDYAVYYRGAIALHALRAAVGSDTFFEILQGWVSENTGTSRRIGQFEKYAEQVSGQDLDDLFDTYLHQPGRPPLPVLDEDGGRKDAPTEGLRPLAPRLVD